MCGRLSKRNSSSRHINVLAKLSMPTQAKQAHLISEVQAVVPKTVLLTIPPHTKTELPNRQSLKVGFPTPPRSFLKAIRHGVFKFVDSVE